MKASESSLARVLDLLGPAQTHTSVEGLCALQRAWVHAQPFHNLDLLAGFGAGRPPLDRAGAWDRCSAGLGGPCHVQASGFLTVLQGLGFDAHFSAGHITHAGDHLLVAVHVGGRSFLCDVGNGHPYLEPFPVDVAAAQRHLGWSVRSRPEGAGLVLEQRTPGAPRWRRVYRASAHPVTWESFTRAIARHHADPGYGPFLRGLRAVRVRPSEVLTLRDDRFCRHTPDGMACRHLEGGHAECLEQQLGLGALPIASALAVWRHQRQGGA